MHASTSSGDVTAGNSSTLVLLIPTSAVGLIIGKAGLFLKYIGHISGATLRLQSFDEMMHGMQERAIFITGEPTSIKSAVQVILLRLQVPSEPGRTFSGGISTGGGMTGDGGDGNSTDQHVIQWIIPQTACGLLIGKNGSRIKMINENSGAWVKIAHPEESGPDVGECFIYIRGTASQTADALTMVKRIAGGRPSKAKEPDQDAHVVSIPMRSVNEVLYLDKVNGVSIQNLFAAEDISITVDTQYVTGFSSAKVVLKGGTKDRLKEVETFILGRLHVWESNNAFNEQHLLNSSLQDRDEEGGESGNSMQDDEGNFDARVRSEMCLLMVYATESAQLVVEITADGKTVFSDLVSLYGVTLELLPENALSASFGSRSRVVALIGPLGSVLHSLGPIQAMFRTHTRGSPAAVMVSPQTKMDLVRSSSMEKMAAGMMGMGLNARDKEGWNSNPNLNSMVGAGQSSMGNNSNRHRGNKRIDQLTATIQELVTAMKQTDMVTDPPFMKFLLAFDEFQQANKSQSQSQNKWSHGSMSGAGQGMPAMNHYQQHGHHTSPLASSNSIMREHTQPHSLAHTNSMHHHHHHPHPHTSHSSHHGHGQPHAMSLAAYPPSTPLQAHQQAGHGGSSPPVSQLQQSRSSQNLSSASGGAGGAGGASGSSAYPNPYSGIPNPYASQDYPVSYP